MIKVFLGILLIAATSFLGYRFADKYKYRAFVFETLRVFNANFIAGIGTINVTVGESLENLKSELPAVMENADDYLSGEKFVCDDKKLTYEQRQFITNYINALGTSDAVGQKGLLKTYSQLLSEEADKVKRYGNDISKLSVRLGFSLGLIIFVVII